MRKTDNRPPYCAVVTKSGSLNFLEPSGPVHACNGTALSLPFTEEKGDRTRDSGRDSRQGDPENGSGRAFTLAELQNHTSATNTTCDRVTY